MPHSQP
jgi:sugar/nucleoside kinase (ribokinase family)